MNNIDFKEVVSLFNNRKSNRWNLELIEVAARKLKHSTNNYKVRKTLKKIRKIIHREKHGVSFGDIDSDDNEVHGFDDIDEDDDEDLEGHNYLENRPERELDDSYNRRDNTFDDNDSDDDDDDDDDDRSFKGNNKFQFDGNAFGASKGILVRHS